MKKNVNLESFYVLNCKKIKKETNFFNGQGMVEEIRKMNS